MLGLLCSPFSGLWPDDMDVLKHECLVFFRLKRRVEANFLKKFGQESFSLAESISGVFSVSLLDPFQSPIWSVSNMADCKIMSD